MIALLLLLSAVSVQVWAFDYCSLNCKWPEVREHTLCGNKYPPGGGSACGDWEMGLSKGDKRMLLVKHNEARQKIASGKESGYPSAADMMVMTWHGECATIAQRWMDQCTLGDGNHDKCFATREGAAGQNLFWGTLPDNDTAVIVRAVHGWYDEEAPKYRGAGHSVNNYQFAMDSGHFTQVAWASTNGLGCGLRKHKKSAASWGATMATYSLCCNYFPAGNYKGASIYKAGPPCSACPEGTACSKKYPALCARPGDDDQDIGGGAGSPRFACGLALVFVLVFVLIR